jgi:hypothetical protein
MALDEALSILDTDVKAAVLKHFSRKFSISVHDDVTLTREEVQYALHTFFGSGGSIVMELFDRCLSALEPKTSSG